ncbi:MAG TPA: AAA family ATPase [Mycobacteriales bacterium]|nr:AAA family ATPase [Mycobacteriales bacterium]
MPEAPASDPQPGLPATGATGDLGRFRSLCVLVCDMVDSTDVRVRLGADGERLLRLLDTITRDVVGTHGGSVVKGLGDGALAVFESATDALAAAVRLQRGLDEMRRRGAATDLAVRLAVSAGDISVGADDCYGLPVAEAVRLCAETRPGEILVTDVVRALARHGLDAPLTPAGQRELRGLREPVTAWRVDWQPRDSGWSRIPLPGRLATALPGQFVGREAELTDLLDRIDAGAPRQVLLLSGEAGVGKTAFAAELARRIQQQHGSVVIYGACDEDLRPPYQPLGHALRHLVRHAPTAALDNYVRRHGGDLAVLVPDLVERLGRVPPPRSTAQSADRYLLFDAVASLLEDVVAETSVVLVLDDLHWADRGTVLLLRHLLTTLELPGLVVIAAFRDTDLAASSGFGDLLAELHRFEGVRRIDLDGLTPVEVEKLAAALLAAQPDVLASLADLVHRETDGNAFFAVQLLRHLEESGDLTAGSGEVQLPPTVREVVRRRVRRLGPDVTQLLSTASVLGVEFHLQTVADVAAMPADTALDLVEAAVAAAVLREVPGGSRFRFVHALVQHTLYDDLSNARRHRLHRAAAEATERLESASTAAAHWLAADDFVDPLRAVAACTAAADEALLARAPDEAARWYAAALDLLAHTRDDELRCELLLRLGHAQRLAGDAEHRSTLLEAAALAQKIGDAERLARAALARTRWFSSIVSSGGEPEQLALVEAALAAVGPQPSSLRAELLATLSSELVYSDRPHERFAVAEEALRIAQLLGEPQTEFDVRLWRSMAGRRPGPRQPAGELAELRTLADRLHDPLRQVMVEVVTVLRRFGDGALSDAAMAIERGDALATMMRLPVLQWLFAVLRTTHATASGELDAAERLAAQALELGQATDQPDTASWFAVQMFMIRLEQGRMDEFEELIDAELAGSAAVYTWPPPLTLALVELGRTAEATQLLGQILDAGYARNPAEPLWPPGMCFLGLAAARLADTAAAAELYDGLVPLTDQWAVVLPLTVGSIDRVLGELALCLGRYADAERHFRIAIASCDVAAAVSFAAQARLGLAATLARQGRGLDDREVTDLLAAVRTTATGHRLPRVRALLEALQVELAMTDAGAPAYPSVPQQKGARVSPTNPG